ncbi:hypothetical protein [uncultured Roseobacter sp.]|uniref:hypothetical protein n=1 Tax=uncultured Roseobacter sp. TaxID=114847 RepID=UPI002611B4AC|nr:hypothetical protein [uncultured Roseobacter sp.]
MTTFSGLDPSERQKVKSLFRRKVAHPVILRDRRQIRAASGYLSAVFGLGEETPNALPVSTLEWSSTTLSFGSKQLALIDVEQANAVSFLLAKSFLHERPIFPYIEFMVRASEFFYSTDQKGLALLVAKKANDRLRRYARSQKHFPRFPRPIAPNEEAFNALTSGMVLSFVTGHEIGHLALNKPGPLNEIAAWVTATYEDNESEANRHSPGQSIRFLKPECVQKFNADGVFSGDIIQGIKFRDRWDYLKQLQQGEAFSDVLGLVAMTHAASEARVEPDVAALVVVEMLEFTEMLMALKRLLPRLPVRGSSANVSYEPTSLGFRRFMFVEAVQAMKERTLPLPDIVLSYWSGLSESALSNLKRANQSGELYSVSNRSVHIARGALLVSSLGHMPEAPSEETIHETFGPMAGNGFFLASCQKIPERWFRINLHDDWTPRPEDEAVPVGYASAICDVANIVKKKSHSDAADEIVGRQGDLDRPAMLDLIRHPREQVFRRRVNGRWPNTVMRHF